MRIINRPRGTGKTIQLIHASEIMQCPIICGTELSKQYIKNRANELGCNIPEPINVIETETGKLDLEDKQVLVDNAEYVLALLLSQRYGCEIKAMTLTGEKVIGENK